MHLVNKKIVLFFFWGGGHRKVGMLVGGEWVGGWIYG